MDSAVNTPRNEWKYRQETIVPNSSLQSTYITCYTSTNIAINYTKAPFISWQCNSESGRL